MRLEILLDTDLAACDQARKEIEKEFNTINYIQEKDYPRFGNFIEIETGNVSDTDTWRITDQLMQVPGVIDVDPDIHHENEEALISNQFFTENKQLNSLGTAYPPPDWYHHDIFFPEAIALAINEAKTGHGHFDGTNRIKVAQLDTGYTRHPEVKNFNIREGHNFLEKENPKDPKDKLNSTRPFPIFWGGHGTSCAGVMIGTKARISLRDPEPEDDLVMEDRVNGVFPNIDLIPYRISRSIISFTNKMAKALDMIIDRGDIPIVSMSHASLIAKRSHRLAVQEAVNKGIVIVAAPGSHIRSFKRVFTYPAKYPETIATAASTVDKVPWKLTHGGKEVDLCAPGFQILIPFPYTKTKRFLLFFRRKREYHAYKWSEGSSFSVPLTACAASLWMLHHGVDKLRTRYPGAELTETLRKLLTYTSQPFNGEVDTNVYGAGILHVKNLIQASLPEGKQQISIDTNQQIFNLSKKIKERQTVFSREKELMHKTLLAKIYTEDKNEDLSEYVMDTASEALKSHLKKSYSSENIKSRVKQYVNEWYGQ